MPFAFHLLPSCAQAQGVWARQPSGTFAWLHAVHFTDPARGWAVGGKGTLLRTEDGGANWRQRPSPTDDALRDVFFTDGLTGWIVCERSIYKLRTEDEPRSYLLKTADGGATWARVEATGKDTNSRLVRVLFSDPAHGWAFGEEGALFATADGGETWTRQRVPTRHLLLGGGFRDARNGWIVGAGATFLYTADGGATWRSGDVVTPSAPDAASAEASATAARVVHASTRAPSPRVNAVSFIDERRGWAVGAVGAMFATANGGRTWRAVESHTDADLFDVKFFDELEGWAVGAGGTVIKTRDGGRTWDAWQTGTTHQLERLFFTDRTRGWAVGFGGTILSFAEPRPTLLRRQQQSEPPKTRPRLRERDARPTP